MRLADGIRKHGFQKWYSRELTRSHLGLLLLLLCTLALFSILELLTRRAPVLQQVGNLGLLAVCVGIGLWALRRYLFLLMHAEAVASQAVCPHCRAYGRLQLLHDEPHLERVQVSCRGCRHEWHISDWRVD